MAYFSGASPRGFLLSGVFSSLTESATFYSCVPVNFYWKVNNPLGCFYLFLCLIRSHVGFDLSVGPLGFNYTKAFSF